MAKRLDRLTACIVETPDRAQKVEKVREHYRGAVAPHRVLARALEIGLEMLAAEPGRLVEH